MIKLSDISKSYRSARGTPVEVLKGMNVNVEPGEFVSVTGPSGCGKSTLLLIAGSLLQPDSGTVVIDGRDFTAMGSDDKALQRAETIGFVFQRFHLLPYLTVHENYYGFALLGVGAVTAGLSAYFFVADQKDSGSSGHGRVSPYGIGVAPVEGGAVASGTFRF